MLAEIFKSVISSDPFILTFRTCNVVVVYILHSTVMDSWEGDVSLLHLPAIIFSGYQSYIVLLLIALASKSPVHSFSRFFFSSCLACYHPHQSVINALFTSVFHLSLAAVISDSVAHFQLVI